MANERLLTKESPAPVRRGAPAAAARTHTEPLNPAQRLQQRLGNQGAAAFVARETVSARTSITTPAAAASAAVIAPPAPVAVAQPRTSVATPLCPCDRGSTSCGAGGPHFQALLGRMRRAPVAAPAAAPAAAAPGAKRAPDQGAQAPAARSGASAAVWRGRAAAAAAAPEQPPPRPLLLPRSCGRTESAESGRRRRSPRSSGAGGS